MTEYLPTAGTTSTITSSETSNASNPDEELKKLKEAMQKDQADAERLKKQMDDRKSKIDSLEKVLSATNQVSNTYTAAVQGLMADRLEIQDFLGNELPQLEKLEIVKNSKNAVEAIIKRVNANIETKDSEQRTLKQKYEDEKMSLQAAIDDLAVRKAGLDGLQNLPRALNDKFGVLRKIHQRIKSEGNNKPLVKYVLALELKTLWDETKPLLIPQEQLAASFFAKAEEVRTAGSTWTTQEEKSKRAQTAFETVSRELDARKAARLDDIVQQVGALASPPIVARPVAAATSERVDSLDTSG
jgi:chromosome segregation ATPase